MRTTRWFPLLFLFGAVALSAQTASIAVTFNKSTIATGDTTRAKCVGRNTSQSITTRTCDWISLDQQIALVSASGLVTGVAPGNARIVAVVGGVGGWNSIRDTARNITPPPTVTVPEVPGKPSFSYTTGATASTVIATWATAARATSYDYHSGRDAGPAWSGAAGTITANTVTMTNVPNGVQFYFCVLGKNAAGAGPETCNAGTVPASPVPPDTTTPPPNPADTSTGHQPAGATLIWQNTMSAKTDWNADSGPWSVVTDATAPKSPSLVGAQVYPVGFNGGASPAILEKALGGQFTTLYSAFWVKLSANWNGHSTGVNKVTHYWIGGSNRVIALARGQGNGLLRWEIATQNAVNISGTCAQGASACGGGEANLDPNVNALAATAVRDRWYKFELTLKNGTNNDGTIDWWINGTQVGHYTGVQIGPSGAKWETFQWSPTWGGTGGTISQSQTMWLDHIFHSGKNDTPVPPTTGAPQPQPGDVILHQDNFDARTNFSGYATAGQPRLISPGMDGSGKAAQFPYFTGNGDNLIEKGIASTQDLYFSYNYRITNNWFPFSANSGSGMKWFMPWRDGSGSTPRYTCGLGQLFNPNWSFFCHDQSVPEQNDTTAKYVIPNTPRFSTTNDGNWHQYVLHVSTVASNGVPHGYEEIWIDGVMVWDTKKYVRDHLPQGISLFQFPGTIVDGPIPASGCNIRPGCTYIGNIDVDNFVIWRKP